MLSDNKEPRLLWKLLGVIGLQQIVLFACMHWIFRDGRTLASLPAQVAFAFLLVGSFVFCWFVANWISVPLQRLAASARRIADGDYDPGIYLGRQDEFGELATSLNRVRKVAAAKTSELNRLSSVLAAMTDGVISLDENQCVQFANQSAGRLLDFSPEAAEGRPLLESVRSYKLHELVTRLFASKSYDELEMEWGEDNPKSLFVNATFISDESSVGIIMTISNLSEIRHLQSMRRDFVANVSHELKTPLSSIKAYAETLQNGAINDAKNRDRFISIIHEQADRLNQLISDLLSLARIEQGKALMELRHVPIQRVVETCVHEQQRAAEEKDIQLIVLGVDPTLVVNVDEDGFRQVLVNLIDNAIKYTPNGGRVSVGWEQTPESIQIYVEDTGLGIPVEMQERVFERFFRVDKARSREIGGTGLGLAIVKHLAQSFGGTVDVKSEPGKGSRFTVYLPLVR